MNNLLLAFLAILIPFIGAILSLIFSQLEDYVAGEGKTQGWLIFLLVLVPTVVVTLLLAPTLHSDQVAFVRWLPGSLYGIRLDELSKLFAIFISIASAIIGLFSITYMSEDSSKTSYWFFFLITQSGMMAGIFANNIYWMFFGFEVASISGFFLISHFYRKSGEDGLKAGKAGLRFFIFNFIGDIFLIVGFALIVRAFSSPVLVDIFQAWTKQPGVIIGDSSTTTRLLIEIFIIIGALIKSAQFPILFWPLTGSKQDADMDKTPLPLIVYLISITLGNIGIFIISCFYPLFSSTGLEYKSTVPLFNEIPFQIIGWAAIVTLFISIGVILSTDNLNRVVTGAAITQLSLSYIALSSANQIGVFASFIHMVSSVPAVIAVAIVFGMIVESIRLKKISRVNGLGTEFILLKIFGIIALLSFIGVFPFSTYFSRDMIFNALGSSIVTSHNGMLILTIIGSILLAIAITKPVIKMLHGEIDQELSIREPSLVSYIAEVGVFIWAIAFGMVIVFWDYPSIVYSRGYFDYIITLEYDFILFSNWIISPIIMFVIPLMFALTFLAYKDGNGKIFDKIRNTKIVIGIKKILENVFYHEQIYHIIFVIPFTFLGRYFSWTRLKSPAAIVIWAILSAVVLFSILFVIGGV